MSLPIPNFDRPFAQIVEEARSLIPGASPEWTDHNVHDPGITFVELFSWLAEIELYRLSRTSEASFERFLSMVGLTRRGRQTAEVTVSFVFGAEMKGLLVPANTKLTPIGHEDVPFQTVRDTYLTAARLKKVVTHMGERAVPQTEADENVAGHYEVFGLAPSVGDSLRLGLEGWFEGEEGHLAITLFEDDLPPREPFAADASGFVPSARVVWEYRTGHGSEDWEELRVIEDGTLHLSRSGVVIFRVPARQPVKTRNEDAGEKLKLNWMRVRLAEGGYEIPPRISGIKTNTLRARQIETVVNEDLGKGLGTPDQVVRLKKSPPFLDADVSDGPFQIGEVLDWEALTLRLAHPKRLRDAEQAALVKYVAERLGKDAGAVIKSTDPTNEEKYLLSQAFDRLLGLPDFYRPETFAGVRIPEEFAEIATAQEGACREGQRTRRFNRLLLQRVFPDLFVSDRVEIQTGTPVERVEDEPNSWVSWERVDDFSRSAPDDRHFCLDAETGRVSFGNGLNGRVPQASEFIRARFYRHSKGAGGNLTARLKWGLGVKFPAGARPEESENPLPAAGGSEPETIDEARARSREVFRKQFPALTAKDYEEQALQTPGLRVARAKVVANFNPNLPKLNLPGEVTVVVVPHRAPKTAFPDAGPPIPGEGFRLTVLNHLETMRLVTTNLHVLGPRYVPVSVRCSVFLKKGASEKETRAAITRALSEFLDPLRGGPESGAGGWPFGRPVFPSEIHQQIARLDGVDYLTGVVLNGQEAGEPVRLPYNGLTVAAEHDLTLITFERRGQGVDSGRRGDCRA